MLAWQQRAPFLALVIVATITAAPVAGIATGLAAGAAAGNNVSFLITAAGYVLTWVAVVRCWRITYRPGVAGFVGCPLFQLAATIVVATLPDFLIGPSAGHSLGFRAGLFIFMFLIGPGMYGLISYVFAGAPSREQLRLQPSARTGLAAPEPGGHPG